MECLRQSRALPKNFNIFIGCASGFHDFWQLMLHKIFVLFFLELLNVMFPFSFK